MRKAVILLLMCFPLLASAQKNREEVEPTAFGFLFDYGDAVTAEGVWRADILNKGNELSKSASHLECYKVGGQHLVGSAAYCMEASAQNILGMITLDVRYFPVIRWDKDVIIAADSPSGRMPVCIWTQITINLREKSAMATDTRKSGKGHEGFNNICAKIPLAQTYHLMDQTQEQTRRQIQKSKQKK